MAVTRNRFVKPLSLLGALAVIGFGLVAINSAANAAPAQGYVSTAEVAIPQADCAELKRANAELAKESCKATVIVEVAAEAKADAAALQGQEASAAGWKRKAISVRWCWGEKKPKQGKHSGWRCQ